MMATLAFNELIKTVDHSVLEALAFALALNKWMSKLCEKDNLYLYYLYPSIVNITNVARIDDSKSEAVMTSVSNKIFWCFGQKLE